MTDAARDQIARCQSLFDDLPDTTTVRVAYLVGIPLARLGKWIERGFVVSGRKAAKAAAEPETNALGSRHTAPPEPRGEGGRGVPLVEADEWDEGEYPTLESLRREIKRKMRSMILDPQSVAQYATALARLQDQKEDERQETEINKSGITIYAPAETRRPPESAE